MLLSIWRKVVRQKPEKRTDIGIVYLSAAIGSWAVAAFWGSFQNHSVWHLAGKSLLSTLNSLLFLLSLPYFDYAPQVIRRAWWRPSMIGLSIAVVFIMFGIGFWLAQGQHVAGMPVAAFREFSGKVLLPEVILSSLTVGILAVVFGRSVYFREYGKGMVILTTAVMGLIVFMQLTLAFPWLYNLMGDEREKFFSVASHALLMMFSVCVASTWGIEELTLPKPEHFHFKFLGRENNSQGRLKKNWLVELTFGDEAKTVSFSKTNMINFIRFLNHRLDPQASDYVDIKEELSAYIYFYRVKESLAHFFCRAENEKPSAAQVEKINRLFFE
ncbi:MAG: hypothetical protein AAB316_17350, partial [Bacteroidota bacterium]